MVSARLKKIEIIYVTSEMKYLQKERLNINSNLIFREITWLKKKTHKVSSWRQNGIKRLIIYYTNKRTIFW